MRTTVDSNSSLSPLRIAALSSLLTIASVGQTFAEAPPNVFPVDHAIEPALLADCGSGCSVVRSAHFVVARNDGSRDVRAHLSWMEQTFRRVERFLSNNAVPVRPLRSRLQVVQTGDWTKVARRLSRPSSQGEVYSGFFDPSTNRSYFGTVPSSRRRGVPTTIIAEFERATIQHEIAHQAIHALSPKFAGNVPEWLSEGLACAFEVAAKQGDEGCRSLNRWRARDAINAFAPSGIAPTVQPPSTGTKPATTNRSPRGSRIVSRIVAARRTDNDNQQLTPSERYAGAWAILFFLQHERPAQLKTYLSHLAEQDAPPSSAWQVNAFFTAFDGDETTLSNQVIERVKAALDQDRSHDAGRENN